MLFPTDSCRRLGLRAGATVFRGLVTRPSPPELRSLIDTEVKAIAQRLSGIEQVRRLVPIQAFRAIHRAVGANPNRQLNSVEGLYRFLIKHHTLPTINNFVDAYNLISIRTGASLGAHDLQKIKAPVTLKQLGQDQTLFPLGGGPRQWAKTGEFAYVDSDDRVLCRLDVVQAAFSKITHSTTEALLIAEATIDHPPETIECALADCSTLIRRYCGDDVEAEQGRQ